MIFSKLKWFRFRFFKNCFWWLLCPLLSLDWPSKIPILWDILDLSHIVSCIKSRYRLAPKLVWQNDSRMSDEVSERRLDMAAGADRNSARTEKLHWGKAAPRAAKKGESKRELGKLNSGPALSVPFCSHSALYILRKVQGYDWAMDRPHILFKLCNGGNLAYAFWAHPLKSDSLQVSKSTQILEPNAKMIQTLPQRWCSKMTTTSKKGGDKWEAEGLLQESKKSGLPTR